MKNRCWHLLSALAITGMLMAQSQLTAAVYTDKTVFTSSGVLESGYYLEQDFNEIPAANTQTPGPIAFSGNGFSYTLVSTSGDVYRPSATPLGTSEVQGYSVTDTLTITFTGADVTAVGGRFFVTDGLGVVKDGSPTPWTLTVNTTGGSFTTSANSSPSWFGGITTVNPITSLSFSSGTTGYYPTFAEFYVGTAVVPEAGGWVAAGFIALVVVGRFGSQVFKRKQAC